MAKIAQRENIASHTLYKWKEKIASGDFKDSHREEIELRRHNAFLALLTDLYNREIVGCAVSWSNDTHLVMQCLKRAQNKRGSLEGAIHHTDADVRYCSHAYTVELKSLQMQISMVCDNVYENAHAEPLNKTLKYKVINLNEFDSLEEAEIVLARYIHFYNEEKPHSSLRWLTPQAFGALSEYADTTRKMLPILGG